MKTLFFYGTLRHIPLLEIVLGRLSSDLDMGPATLPGYEILAALSGPFPVPVASPDHAADGIVVRNLSDIDLARLNFYEAGFDYDLRSVTLVSGEVCEVYLPRQIFDTRGLWDVGAWVQHWGAMSVYAAQEVMDQMGAMTPEQIAPIYPRIRARAWSRVLAQSGRHGQDTLHGQVEIMRRARPYSNFFAVDDITLRHQTFAGGMSEVLNRAVFVTSDAAIVLPYDPVRDRVLLVEQIRLGPIGRHDPVLWQMEPVAGLVDPGETPQETAQREGHEEAGLTFYHLEPVGECYASPGAATDFFHLFVGLCDLPDDAAGIGGAVEEGENIRSHLMSFEDVLAMAEARKTANAPLTLLTYWLAHHRTRLRA
ncbi:MAG: NUDIX domain-containing protein [Pseudomonadota bacterium]